MKISIIDYKAGNLTSVKLAIDHIGVSANITSNPKDILSSDRVIFPGVGAAKSAMSNLMELNLKNTINEIIKREIPFLGICLGMQILLDKSEEGNTKCIGAIPGSVKKFNPQSKYDKVPQMGWNNVYFKQNHPIFEGIKSGSEFYFVHSYFVDPIYESDTYGTTEYAGVEFASVIGSGSLIATQFHPEKSGKLGLKILKNFCNWNGVKC